MAENSDNTPKHVAIVMDGNGRWAQQRKMERTEGHKQGGESVKAVLRAAKRHGLEHLTLFAFSSENWNRPANEVAFLMSMLLAYLREQLDMLVENKIRFNTVGDTSVLSEEIQTEIQRAKDLTADFKGAQLNLALNYGSRQEVLEAAKAVARDAASGKVDLDSLEWPQFSEYLHTAGVPDPDLIIRTSGECRLSNFLLMQSAYAEFYFSPVLWPDFDESAFEDALAYYASKERRFGLTSEQLKAQSPAR